MLEFIEAVETIRGLNRIYVEGLHWLSGAKRSLAVISIENKSILRIYNNQKSIG
jgi:hypothetical protein